jgi:hypothetical protein
MLSSYLMCLFVLVLGEVDSQVDMVEQNANYMHNCQSDVNVLSSWQFVQDERLPYGITHVSCHYDLNVSYLFEIWV